MTDRERFLAICRGEKPDYYPIYGSNGAPGVSGGAMRKTYDRLMATGMPDIGGTWEVDGLPHNLEGWRKYWGTTGPREIVEFAGEPSQGFCSETEVKDGYEHIRCETGALTRQVIGNAITYSMPEFIRYHVRDRKSWEFYKERSTPGRPWPAHKLEALGKKYAGEDKPVQVEIRSTFGGLRDIMGPEMACMIFYDDPVLLRDILGWFQWYNREYILPVIEAVKPDIVLVSEDLCYNHGMMIGPAMFREFCLPLYMEVGEAARAAGVPVFIVDTDGFAEPFVQVVADAGVNALFPWEVKAKNDLMRVRRNYPEFILMGGLEKECLNEGNEGMIPSEITKARGLLPLGRYFPNADHGIQPLATYENLCRFMTLLHEACGNPEGVFPRCR